MRCVECGFVMPAPLKFCGECGVRLEVAQAGATTPERNYTPPHLAQKILQTRSALEGERKQVTVLFCDIADSTPLAARIGPDRMHTVLNAFFGAALAEVHRFEGTVNQFLGDGFMALFGAPLSHEDHARRAVLAALAIRKAIASDSQFQAPGIELRTRIGLNTGAVVVGRIGDNLRMDYTAIGDTTNVAARIQGLAEPGTILVSDAVARSTMEYVEYQPVGPRVLKGKSEPIALHQIVREHSHRVRSANRADTMLVGRQAELQTIDRSLEQLQAGAGCALAIVGEAGLGKSRLLEEATRRASEGGLRVVQGSCLSFGRTLSYWPFRELIRAAFDIDDTDGDASGWDKLDVGMKTLFPDGADELLPYIGTLLALTLPKPLAERIRALDGVSMGHQIFRSVLLLFERLALQKPTVLGLEDWHWADASSVGLLEHVLPLADRVPLMYVVASRPESQGAAASLYRALTADERTVQRVQLLALAPLGTAQSAELAERLLGGGALPSDVRDMLLHRSGGNPFYLGELVRALIGTKGIERDTLTGDWCRTEQYMTMPLPDTIEGLILARIDRLEDEVKQVLKAAAVVGRTFFYRVLRAVADSTALDNDLVHLRNADLIDQKRLTPELEFIFRHPLIQQATYGSLLDDQRRSLHAVIARTIEALFSERLDEFLSILAYHYAQAEDWEHAYEYLFKAGDQAGRIAADAEALDHYEKALHASRSSARALDAVKRAELDRRIGEALFRLGRHQAALEHLFAGLSRLGVTYPKSQRGVAMAIGLKLLMRAIRGAKRRLFGSRARPAALPSSRTYSATQALETIGAIDFFQNPPRYVLSVLMGLEFAESHAPSRALVVYTSAFGQVCDSLALRRIARAFHAESHRMAVALGDDLALGYCHLLEGMHQHVAGDWVGATQSLELSLQRFRAVGHLHSQSAVLMMEIAVLRSRGEPRWLQLVDEAVALATESQDEQAIGWASAAMGARSLHRDDFASAAIAFEDACSRIEEVHDWRSLAHMLARLALCEARLGKLRRALEHLEKAEKVMASHRFDPRFEGMAVAPAAEAYLSVAEQTPDVGMRNHLLRCAKRACDRLTRIGRRVSEESAPEALRLNGTYRWLCGDKKHAVTLWQRGIKVAEEMQALHVLAKLHQELGLRTGDEVHVQLAKVLFVTTGALGT